MRATTATLTAALAAAAVVALPVSDSSAATKRPCYLHTADTTPTRAACLREYRAKRARDAQPFPARPTWRDVAKRVPDYATFLRIARCEQPGSGEHGVLWTVRGPRYEGGMGFFHATWDGWRPKHYPGNAGDATPQQQVLVADAVRDSVGISAWGCA